MAIQKRRVEFNVEYVGNQGFVFEVQWDDDEYIDGPSENDFMDMCIEQYQTDPGEDEYDEPEGVNQYRINNITVVGPKRPTHEFSLGNFVTPMYRDV